ncbi:MAG: UDP-2,3-diacylglucosamine diphosphatase [Robiginitalea sp.]
MNKRQIEIAVISDIYLGAECCHAAELLTYLNSIKPKKLVLNGDIIDIRNLDKGYFPPAHFSVLKRILGMAANGTEVYYLTGEHDERLRKLSTYSISNVHFRNELILELDGKKTWIFHGAAFDHSSGITKWIARLGSAGRAFLLRLNRWINIFWSIIGKPRVSLADSIKYSDDPSWYYGQFEQTVTSLAIRKAVDHVICGHIHHPKKQWHQAGTAKCLYMNSGDWVDHYTALEYNFKRWKLYQYNEDKLSPFFADSELKEMDEDELLAAIAEPKKGVGKKHLDKVLGK